MTDVVSVAQNESPSGEPDRTEVPFDVLTLDSEKGGPSDSNEGHHGNRRKPEASHMYSLLPAAYRSSSKGITACSSDVEECIKEDLDLKRLTEIHNLLKIVGLPRPPRPLHYQLAVKRAICISEQMDLHLVWSGDRMFLKPIPRYLLSPDFWKKYLACKGDSADHNCVKGDIGLPQDCPRRGQWKCAVGFLRSYAALISYESDFILAKSHHLLPAEVKWEDWRVLVEQLLEKTQAPSIDHRFAYGELRLSRLNKIYTLYKTPLRGYVSRYNEYGAFWRENFAWLATAAVYITIVLTAMQVGLATKRLGGSGAFQAASFGFTVFSILGPLGAATLMFIIFMCMVVSNALFAWNNNHKLRKEKKQGAV